MLKTPIRDKNVNTARKVSAIDVASKGVDVAADLGLHYLQMSVGPFSHDAGHMLYQDYDISYMYYEKIKIMNILVKEN